jgi:amino acid transporter
MSTHYKLSLPTTILINLNIMIGVGVFINTIALSKIAGALGSFAYIAIGILMLPLILSISKLLELHPSGGFYTFASCELSPFVGFISTWSYFIGKLSSTAIMTHVSILFIQELLPITAHYNPFILDLCVLGLFTILNMQNMKTGGTLQIIFTTLKLFPLIFLILTGIFLANPDVLVHATYTFSSIPTTLPLVLYSILGFEAACSLSSSIENAEKNASRAVLISYTAAITLYVLYQTVVYTVIGSELALLDDYRAVFPAFLTRLFGSHSPAMPYMIGIFHCALASSALSAAYSIMFSNVWNLVALAKHNHIPGGNWIAQLNSNHIPWLCVLAEAIIAVVHLSVTRGNQVPLQVTSALGCSITYLLSAVSLLTAKINRPGITIHWIIPLLALGSCTLLLSSCLYTLYRVGFQALTSFSILLTIGIGMYWFTKK